MPPDMPEGFDGEIPEGFDPSDIPEGFSGGLPGQSTDDLTQPTQPGGSDSAGDADISRPSGGNMQMTGGDFSSDMNGSGSSSSDPTGWIWTAVSVPVLGAGIIIAKFYEH